MNTKKDIRNFILLVLFYICAVMLSAFLAFGCSATRLHEKAVKKGYVHAIHVDTLKVGYVDTMYINGKDSLVFRYKDSLIYSIDTQYVPKWRTRFDNKRFADSLAHIRAMYSDSLKNARKMAKIDKSLQETKQKQQTKQTKHQSKPSTGKLYVIGLIIGLLLVAIVYILSKLTKFLV